MFKPVSFWVAFSKTARIIRVKALIHQAKHADFARMNYNISSFEIGLW
jgi:hypothetical protein